MMIKTRTDRDLTQLFMRDSCAALTQQFRRPQTKCCLTVAHVQRGQGAGKQPLVAELRQLLPLQQGFKRQMSFFVGE